MPDVPGPVLWGIPSVSHAVTDTYAARAIEAKRQQHPWLGNAVGPVTKTPNGRGFYQHYENGSIYQHGSSLSLSGGGAFEVHGAIRDKWAALGWENGFLGFPVSDEHDVPGGGRRSDFEHGWISFTNATNAHEVHGAIGDLWQALGAEGGFLGYPVTDEQDFGFNGGRFSDFQGGRLSWSPELGAAAVSAIDPAHDGAAGPVEVRRVVSLDVEMSAHDDEFIGPGELRMTTRSTRDVLTSAGPRQILEMITKVGGEVRVELRLTATVRRDGSVELAGDLLLYEGDSENTDDLDGRTPVHVVIARDGRTNHYVGVENPGAGDWGSVRIVTDNRAV